MEFVDTYVELHRVRLGDCLTVAWQVDEAVREDAQLPPLTLQVLVENIVKHNAISPSRPMTVDVEVVKDEEGFPWLRVSNGGSGGRVGRGRIPLAACVQSPASQAGSRFGRAWAGQPDATLSPALRQGDLCAEGRRLFYCKSSFVV